MDQDQIVHEELDERFFMNVGKTQDQRYILCALGSSITSEYLFVDANHPGEKLQVFLVRWLIGFDIDASMNHLIR